jgi:adenosyl cobinamide kinase/adenosyl cobinamide phosphate guanylyltransferase
LDLVCDGLAVDRIPHIGVLNLECLVVVVRDIVPAGLLDNGLLDIVPGAVRVPVRSAHWKGFIVNKTIVIAIKHGIHAQAEDVLMVDCEDAWVNNSAERNVNTFVNGLCAEDAGRTDLVIDLSSLIEDEGKNILIVGNGDDGL